MLCDNRDYMIIVMKNINYHYRDNKICDCCDNNVEVEFGEISDLLSRYCFGGQIIYPATKAGVHIIHYTYVFAW